MILLEKNANLIQFLSTLRVSGIHDIHAVVDEGSATKILANAATTGVQMIATLPGTKIDMESVDTHSEENAVIAWVVAKGGGPAAGKIVQIEEYMRLLTLMRSVLEAFRAAIRETEAGRCPLLAGMNIEQIIVTPEYNIFGGWDGWCATLTIR